MANQMLGAESLSNSNQADQPGQTSLSYFGSMNLAFKQQMEMCLDNERSYEHFRQEGRKQTWEEVK